MVGCGFRMSLALHAMPFKYTDDPVPCVIDGTSAKEDGDGGGCVI